MNEKTTASRYTYRDAGVDIDAGNALVEVIKPLAEQTERPGTMGSLGGFGGLFDLQAAGYADPILVAATDGVGTKLKIAHQIGHHKTIGIDLVAMCVNDLIVQGAEPLFFLDYFATGKLSQEVAASVISGIAEGCKQAGCALIGGETAEMPGMYSGGEYDLAGFAVGAAERNLLLPRDIKEGDALIGLASNGLHSNGYSLVRRLINDHGLKLDDPAPFDPERTLGLALLDPTQIYSKLVVGGLHAGKLNGLAHITGGGLTENTPRTLPKGHIAEIELSSWPLPGVFAWLNELGSLGQEELLKTFNCGIGLVLVAPRKNVSLLMKSLTESGQVAFEIGQVGKAEDSEAPPQTRYFGKLEPA